MGLRGRYNNKENGTYYGALVFFWDRSTAKTLAAAVSTSDANLEMTQQQQELPQRNWRLAPLR